MITSDYSSVKEKVFYLISEMKLSAQEKGTKLAESNHSTGKNPNSGDIKQQLSRKLTLEARNTFVSRFVNSNSSLEKAQLLKETLVNAYTAMFLNQEQSPDLDTFLKECEVEYHAQVRSFVDEQFENLLNYDGVQLCDALLVLIEAGDLDADSKLKAIPSIMELKDLNAVLLEKLSLVRSQNSQQSYREMQEIASGIAKYEENIELRSYLDSIYTEIRYAFDFLASRIEEKIEKEKSSPYGSAAAVIEYMKEYRQLEVEFLITGITLSGHRHDSEREKLERDLQNLSEIMNSIGSVFEETSVEKNPAQRIVIANTEITRITTLSSSLDSRYVEFKEVGSQLENIRKQYMEMMDKDIASLLDISLKVPEDYTSLQPENQFRHWKERLAKFDTYQEGLAEVDKAVSQISKAKAKLILSGESYAVDICRRYPKKTGSFSHHLAQFDTVVNGLEGVKGTERIKSELAQHAAYLRKAYDEFIKESQFVGELLTRLNQTILTEGSLSNEDLSRLSAFITKYNDHVLLTYPEIQVEWYRIYKLFQKNQTAIDEMLEQNGN